MPPALGADGQTSTSTHSRTNTDSKTGTFPIGKNSHLTHNSPHPFPCRSRVTTLRPWHQQAETGQIPAGHLSLNLQRSSSRRVVRSPSPITHHPDGTGHPGIGAGGPGTYLAAPRAPTAPSSRAAAGPSTPWCFLSGRDRAAALPVPGERRNRVAPPVSTPPGGGGQGRHVPCLRH